MCQRHRVFQVLNVHIVYSNATKYSSQSHISALQFSYTIFEAAYLKKMYTFIYVKLPFTVLIWIAFSREWNMVPFCHATRNPSVISQTWSTWHRNQAPLSSRFTMVRMLHLLFWLQDGCSTSRHCLKFQAGRNGKFIFFIQKWKKLHPVELHLHLLVLNKVN